MLESRAVKTGGPPRLGPALTGFGLDQKARFKNVLEIYYPSPALHGPARIKNYIILKKILQITPIKNFFINNIFNMFK